MKKLLLLLLILSNILLTGCWNSREINTLAITVCVGIDRTTNGYLLTQQILNPTAIASEKTLNQPAVVLYTGEGKDLFEAYRRITTECPRKIYNSHLRMVVFGEDVAKEGIKDILDLFSRDHEFRTDFYFVVAKGTTANKVLSVLTPLEPVPGLEMYNSLITSEKAWAPTKAVKIVELVNNIIAEGKDPVLTAVEITGGLISSSTTDSLKLVASPNRLKFTGLGAFNDDKLAGWLNEDESKGYNYITGNINNTVGYSEYDEHGKITFEVTSSRSKMKAYFLNGRPAINVEIEMEINVGTVTGDLDVSMEENFLMLNDITNKKITNTCNSAIKKVKEDIKADIFGFGEVIHRAYPGLWKKLKVDWNNEFVNLPVNVVVNAKTKKLGQITRPLFMKGSN